MKTILSVIVAIALVISQTGCATSALWRECSAEEIWVERMQISDEEVAARGVRFSDKLVTMNDKVLLAKTDEQISRDFRMMIAKTPITLL